MKKILIAALLALSIAARARGQSAFAQPVSAITVPVNGGTPVVVVPSPGAFGYTVGNPVCLQATNSTTWLFGACGSGGSNVLLDGSVHSDTVAFSVVRGAMMIGNSTPKWGGLAIGAAGTALASNGTDPAWTKPTLYDYAFKAQDAQFLSANFPTLVKNGTNFPLMSLSYTNQPATSQDAFFEFEVPKYDSGNLTLRILWYTAGTTNNVIWRAAIAAVTPDADAAVTTKAFATDQSTTTAASGTANRLVSTSITITNLDSLAAGDKVWIKVTRDRTDTTTSPAFLVSARISYTGIF